MNRPITKFNKQRYCKFKQINNNIQIIVFVWSQYDGGNIKQRTIGYGCRQNQEAKLKIVAGVIPRSNQQEADPTSSFITSVIMS